jgi:hypothetical protein
VRSAGPGIQTDPRFIWIPGSLAIAHTREWLSPRNDEVIFTRAGFDAGHHRYAALGCGDIERTIAAVCGVAGKRLMYHQAH